MIIIIIIWFNLQIGICVLLACLCSVLWYSDVLAAPGPAANVEERDGNSNTITNSRSSSNNNNNNNSNSNNTTK